MNLFIELCNFTDYPLGGQLSFAKHLTHAMQGDLHLAGISTNTSEPVHQWFTKRVEDADYKIFNVYHTQKRSKKPFIPTRISDYFKLKSCISKLNLKQYDNIIVQAPEVLLCIPNTYLHKVVLIMPGVENPLSISRYKMARNFQKFYDKVFFKKAHSVHQILAAADNQSIQACIERSKGQIKKEQISQFPTRYDSNIFNIKDTKKLRQQYGISDSHKIIVTTGRLNWFKGWKLMIDAFNIFLRTNHDATLYFIGDGEDREKIENYIMELQLSKHVKLIGFQSLDTISDYLNMADLFIMGSYKEGWSTSLVEAVSCGAPCVVTDFSSATEMVHNGINGYVVSERDESLFAERMDNALSLPYENLIQAAQNIQCLSVGNMRKEFEKFLLK